MKVNHNSSTESRKCIVCGNITGLSKIYMQSGIEVLIPVCEEHYDNIDVKKFLTSTLINLKRYCKQG